MAQRQVFHVSSADAGKWRVEPEGKSGTGQVFEDKDEAVSPATEHAKAAPPRQKGIACSAEHAGKTYRVALFRRVRATTQSPGLPAAAVTAAW
jgi:hypothetical protein